MCKKVKISVGIILIFFVTVIIVLYFSINSIVASGIRTIGTKATGTNVVIKSVDISPLVGSIVVKGLCIANPKDYYSDNAFVLGHFYMDLNLRSILTDKIIINNVIIYNYFISKN